MDVNEVVGLAQWIDNYVSPEMNSYELLANSMEQNANSGSKVPLRGHLDAVEIALRSMPVEQLSYQQSDLLEGMEVLHLLGPSGWRYIEDIVKVGNFDPASAASDLRKAKQKIDQTIRLFAEVRRSLFAIDIQGDPKFSSAEKVTVRLRFKDSTEISNVSQLKKWASEWYDISRGLAMATGERPEDIEVKGATTGSLIIILGTSIAVASAIALIAKQIASTVKSSMEIAHTLQDWKMRKVADAEVERVLLERQRRIEDDGVDTAFQLVREEIGTRVAGEVEGALKKSIEKMFSFASKGGEVDILPPPQPAEGEQVDDNVVTAIKTITENVEEMRTLKAATQLLIEDKAEKA